MKNLILIISCFFFLQHSFGQISNTFKVISADETPPAVLKAFAKDFPEIIVDRWGLEGEIYEAKFKQNKKWHFKRYNEEGALLESRVLMNWKNAPENLKSGKNKTAFKYWEVEEYYEVESALGDQYYILLMTNEQNELQTLYFDEEGNLNDKSKSGY